MAEHKTSLRVIAQDSALSDIRGIFCRMLRAVDKDFGKPRVLEPYLVGGLVAIFYFPILIGNLIIPIDELHHFSEGW